MTLLEDVISKREGAAILRVSIWTIEAWLSQGKLRRIKAGGRTLLSRSDLERFLQQGSTPVEAA